MKRNSFNVVIDNLKVCYKRSVEKDFWKKIAEKPETMQVGDITLYREKPNGTYDGVYSIFFNQEKYGTIFFDRYSEREKRYFWLSVENSVFYTDRLPLLSIIQKELEWGEINNVTKMEIACDITSFNPVKKIKKLLKRSDIDLICSSKKIKSMLEKIKNLFCQHPLCRLKELPPDIYYRDKKKRKSLKIYNKNEEIQESGKTYISDYYGNPKRLYRAEISMSSDELYRYFHKSSINPSVDLLKDDAFLREIYDETLFRLIHFVYKRKAVGLIEAINAL